MENRVEPLWMWGDQLDQLLNPSCELDLTGKLLVRMIRAHTRIFFFFNFWDESWGLVIFLSSAGYFNVHLGLRIIKFLLFKSFLFLKAIKKGKERTSFCFR